MKSLLISMSGKNTQDKKGNGAIVSGDKVPFSSLEIGSAFRFRACDYTKINDWEAVKEGDTAFHYANFGMVHPKQIQDKKCEKKTEA